MRRKYFLIAIALTFALIMSACGGDDNNNNANDNGNDNDNASGELSGEITFNTMELSPTFDDYLNGLIDEFEEMHPDVTVNWDDGPAGQIEQKTLIRGSGGDIPD